MKLIRKSLLLTLPLMLLASEATVEQLFSVQTVKVKKETSSQKIKNYGFVKADTSKVYDISPRYGGYVVKLYADKIYKKVKKGEALLEVYSPDVLKAKDEYLNTLEYNKKRANKNMLESSRLKLQLLGISDYEINQITKNEISSANTTIYSPVDGYIFMKNINQGSAFNAKTKLFQIVNLDKVWVEVKLLEEQRAFISATKKYELSFNGIDKVYTTTSRFLYPQLDPKIATLTLRLTLGNKHNRLFPGMYANVTSFKENKEHLVLPTTAVLRKDAKYYVFMVGEYEGEYDPVEVQAKVINSSSYEITSGLSEGDEVVNNALFMMDSDAQINSLY